eukprot:TRINITY_DN27830_c0_g1_i1.p1 TRINITY_DN27830_c0_g1~~TRINITY_DN27830_c0_g1_i1.p1  ORF type:complete len:990 (+),score=216.90 TRINITY_DN27830_c0_g1_i1:126-3095(+)
MAAPPTTAAWQEATRLLRVAATNKNALRDALPRVQALLRATPAAGVEPRVACAMQATLANAMRECSRMRLDNAALFDQILAAHPVLPSFTPDQVAWMLHSCAVLGRQYDTHALALLAYLSRADLAAADCNVLNRCLQALVLLSERQRLSVLTASIDRVARGLCEQDAAGAFGRMRAVHALAVGKAALRLNRMELARLVCRYFLKPGKVALAQETDPKAPDVLRTLTDRWASHDELPERARGTIEAMRRLLPTPSGPEWNERRHRPTAVHVSKPVDVLKTFESLVSNPPLPALGAVEDFERGVAKGIREALASPRPAPALRRVLDYARASVAAGGDRVQYSFDLLRNVAFACAKTKDEHPLLRDLLPRRNVEEVEPRNHAVLQHALSQLGHGRIVCRLAKLLRNDTYRHAVLGSGAKLSGKRKHAAQAERMMLLRALVHPNVRPHGPPKGAVDAVLTDVCRELYVLDLRSVVAVGGLADKAGLIAVAERWVHKFFMNDGKFSLRQLSHTQAAILFQHVMRWKDGTKRRELLSLCVETIPSICSKGLPGAPPQDQAVILTAAAHLVADPQTRPAVVEAAHVLLDRVPAAIVQTAFAGWDSLPAFDHVTRVAWALAKARSSKDDDKCGVREDEFFAALAERLPRMHHALHEADVHVTATLAWAFMRAGHAVPQALHDALAARFGELKPADRAMVLDAVKASPGARGMAFLTVAHIERDGLHLTFGTGIRHVARALRWLRECCGGDSMDVPVVVYRMVGEHVARFGVADADAQALSGLLYEANGGVVAAAVVAEVGRRGLRGFDGRSLAVLAWCHTQRQRFLIGFWTQLEALAAEGPLPRLSATDSFVLARAVLTVPTTRPFTSVYRRIAESLEMHPAHTDALNAKQAATMAVGVLDAPGNAHGDLLEVLYAKVKENPDVLSLHETRLLIQALLKCRVNPKELFNQLRDASRRLHVAKAGGAEPAARPSANVAHRQEVYDALTPTVTATASSA